jgi:Pyridoxamine 5'-phosphate oxidase
MTEVSKRDVHAFLDAHPLATASIDGEPWGSAIFCIADEQFNFFFITKTGTTKYAYIRDNPRVALTITDEQAQITVQAYGIAHDMQGTVGVSDAYTRLSRIPAPDTAGWRPPVSKVRNGGYMLMRLVPEMLQYSSFAGDHPFKTPVQRII